MPVSFRLGSEKHFRHLVEVHGMEPMAARQIVEIEAGRSDGDCLAVQPPPPRPPRPKRKRRQ